MSKTPDAPLPFSFVAHKDGRWGGMISPQHFTHAQLCQWIGEYVLLGFEIKACADIAEHKAFSDPMQPCGGTDADAGQEALPL